MRVAHFILAAWAITNSLPCFVPSLPGKTLPALSRAELLQHERLVAISVVDSSALNYRVVGAESLDIATLGTAGRLFFHLRVDSAAEARSVMQRANGFVSLATIPTDIGHLPVKQKKNLFFSILQSITRFHNETILARRARLKTLGDSASDQVFLQAMVEYYALARSENALSTRADTLRELMRRVDVIPPSLALAQGAIESGWGTSRFAREGNNLYGQRVWRSDIKGMAAAGVQNSRFRLAVFDYVSASVRSYMRNLNTHPSYEDLREIRARDRAQNHPIRGHSLAEGLRSYSIRGEEYVADVQRLIRGNALGPLDEMGRNSP